MGFWTMRQALGWLANRLARRDLQVVTVLSGCVRTVVGRPLSPRLTIPPKGVAGVGDRAIAHKRDVVYVRPIWHMVVLVTRLIPEFLYRRMKP